MCVKRIVLATVLMAMVEPVAYAQNPPVDHSGHDMSAMGSSSPWTLMYDGLVFGTVNHQGGPSGGDEFTSTNWVMGMAIRPVGAGVLQLSGMLSLDAATTGGNGYRELFQVGETYKGEPLVDRQHPHDFLMQAAVAWRVPATATTAITLAGAPVGEPALGPTAFMHRPSAADNVAAPLAHHTLDSTHIAMGVLTVGVERGPWTLESSVFHGGEPDDNRWDLMDPGALDSWSVRGWYQPTPAWQFQISHGFLSEPEALEPGDVRRTTASAEWWRPRPNGFGAATVAYGRNDTSHGSRNAVLVEATDRRGRRSLFGRFEALQVESAILAGPGSGLDDEDRAPVAALTLGASWEMVTTARFELGLGGDVTLYGVPGVLESTHGRQPTSFHVFLRLRPRAPMWNMRMSRVSAQEHGQANHGQAGHQ